MAETFAAAPPLRRSAALGMAGQLAYVAGQFLVLLLLARLGSAEDLGRFGLASAVAVPVFWFCNLGLRFNQATDAAGAHRFAELLALRGLATLAGAVLILTLGLALAGPGPAFAILALVAAAKAVESLSDLCYGAFQRAERMGLVARSLALRGLGGAAAFGAALAATGAPEAAFLALFAVWAAAALLADLPLALRLAGPQRPPRPAAVLSLARASLPLGLAAFLSAAGASLPRLLVGQGPGLAALGQFTLVGYAMQASATFATALSHSAAARLARHAARGETRAFRAVLRRLLTAILAAGAAATALAALSGGPLLRLVFGPDYAGLGGLLALALVAATAQAMMIVMQTGLIARRRFRLHAALRAAFLPLMALCAGAGLALAGLEGVAAGMAVAYALQTGLLALLLRRAEPGA